MANLRNRVSVITLDMFDQNMIDELIAPSPYEEWCKGGEDLLVDGKYSTDDSPEEDFFSGWGPASYPDDDLSDYLGDDVTDGVEYCWDGQHYDCHTDHVAVQVDDSYAQYYQRWYCSHMHAWIGLGDCPDCVESDMGFMFERREDDMAADQQIERYALERALSEDFWADAIASDAGRSNDVDPIEVYDEAVDKYLARKAVRAARRERTIAVHARKARILTTAKSRFAVEADKLPSHRAYRAAALKPSTHDCPTAKLPERKRPTDGRKVVFVPRQRSVDEAKASAHLKAELA